MDPTKRFSNRAENYTKYRPGYPDGVLKLLQEECGLRKTSVIADVGSGTGNLARLFLDNGNQVLGVEPNDEMRRVGETLLGGYPRFASVPATAEKTTLDASSVNFVTAGQAFHWFYAEMVRTEFSRILKPGGWVVLVWNARKKDNLPFLADYERLLEVYGTDHAAVKSDRVGDEAIESFFGFGEFESRTFENVQHFDLEGLKGRLLSSSYAPEKGHPNHNPMLEELQRIFYQHQHNGTVAFEYAVRVYYGRPET